MGQVVALAGSHPEKSGLEAKFHLSHIIHIHPVPFGARKRYIAVFVAKKHV
jgi:hypothetical protein